MQSAVPKPDTTRLDDVLVALAEVRDSIELEALLRQLNLSNFEPGLSEIDRAQLLDAVAAATARCWAARSYCGSGEC
jgi:hypothetical protein